MSYREKQKRTAAITGHDRDDVGMMFFADVQALLFALP